MNKQYTPDFEHQISGVPCGVVVTDYQPGDPGHINRSPGAGFGDAEEPVEPVCEFILVDADGYRSEVLEFDMTSMEREEIERMIAEGAKK